MSAKSATLAKSLHTVSAIVAVAREFMRQPAVTADEGIRIALDILGYTGAADPHGLAAKARAILVKDAK